MTERRKVGDEIRGWEKGVKTNRSIDEYGRMKQLKVVGIPVTYLY
jgi:hypothetical protein